MRLSTIRPSAPRLALAAAAAAATLSLGAPAGALAGCTSIREQYCESIPNASGGRELPPTTPSEPAVSTPPSGGVTAGTTPAVAPPTAPSEPKATAGARSATVVGGVVGLAALGATGIVMLRRRDSVPPASED